MIVRTLVLAVVALSLAACGDGKGRCKAPEAPKANANGVAGARPISPGQDGYARQQAMDASDGAKACVQHYAWRLTKSADETPVVAQAVVTACDAAIAKVTEAEQSAYGTRDLNEAHRRNVEVMTRWATLYLVQYRAGVCD
ncbi:hypothetical protein [Caulobacter mirabilis]|uniref:Lipoprotein n=1 Tax=Caulobacter mirabilis TaxID=69666 RepID=A0A2D2ATS2_9CAUL|nr:hypothetical protein [Caulobacter mirabilis]ATQ41412.1 hypothetical protein CSW64_02775 [Caulobacter mirabilis]